MATKHILTGWVPTLPADATPATGGEPAGDLRLGIIAALLVWLAVLALLLA